MAAAGGLAAIDYSPARFKDRGCTEFERINAGSALVLSDPWGIMHGGRGGGGA